VETSATLAAGSADFTWHTVLGAARTDPFALCADAAICTAAIAYAAGLRRHPGRADPPRWAAVSFVCGLAALFFAFGSGFARAQYVDPSVDVAQHVLCMMVAPPLLVLGHPGRVLSALVARGARGAAPPGSGSVRRLQLIAHRASGVVSWLLYYGSMAGYFLTTAYARSLGDPGLLDASQAAFVAIGLLFWGGLFGAGRSGAPRSSAFRLVALIAGMPAETAVGLALVLWPTPLATGETLAATHAAGLLLWLGSMFTSGVALAALVVQWGLAEERRVDVRELLAARDSQTIPAIGDRPRDAADRPRPWPPARSP
jgi:cytochrome c oxidase assembly factor CtaG